MAWKLVDLNCVFIYKCMLVYNLSGLVQQAQRCATFIFVDFSEIY